MEQFRQTGLSLKFNLNHSRFIFYFKLVRIFQTFFFETYLHVGRPCTSTLTKSLCGYMKMSLFHFCFTVCLTKIILIAIMAGIYTHAFFFTSGRFGVLFFILENSEDAFSFLYEMLMFVNWINLFFCI